MDATNSTSLCLVAYSGSSSDNDSSDIDQDLQKCALRKRQLQEGDDKPQKSLKTEKSIVEDDSRKR